MQHASSLQWFHSEHIVGCGDVLLVDTRWCCRSLAGKFVSHSLSHCKTPEIFCLLMDLAPTPRSSNVRSKLVKEFKNLIKIIIQDHSSTEYSQSILNLLRTSETDSQRWLGQPKVLAVEKQGKIWRTWVTSEVWHAKARKNESSRQLPNQSYKENVHGTSTRECQNCTNREKVPQCWTAKVASL